MSHFLERPKSGHRCLSRGCLFLTPNGSRVFHLAVAQQDRRPASRKVVALGLMGTSMRRPSLSRYSAARPSLVAYRAAALINAEIGIQQYQQGGVHTWRPTKSLSTTNL